ncbi:aminoacyl-tRNA hydrolase [Dechloromonas denitrificans]|uniref:aminoacyl-tRNA hydrolase n=1 Tax=Dechloromonas denitrificans TaxID=281362 RepID=UPI001CF813C4|nr:aminoacyl-tRNA hydrolase [Dechloromonas denitrificans]UCV01949.1 aminoacyl-tRNA hydrolase [Dechloromonas denitrificans]
MKFKLFGKPLYRHWKAISGALEWRIRSRIGDQLIDSSIIRIALKYRQLVNATQFIGIAGSVGKTTAKDILVGILSVCGKTSGTPLSLNAAPEVAKVVLRTRPWYRFCAAELGESSPGSLDTQLAVLQPSIGIITVVGDDHLTAFGSRSAIAREFAKLVEAIPAHGTIVLNIDDELVSGLHTYAKCPVLTYGTSANANLQATDITSIWPYPLQFTANFKGESVAIHTQLYSRQLLTSALAAIGGGLAAGLTLADCAQGISRTPPAEGRMQPVIAPRGITFIRDDFKSPAWTVRPLLEQLGAARAKRKIFVLGTISNCQHKEHEIFKLAQEALQVADIAIFTGRLASAALKAHRSGTESRLQAFTQIHDVATYLESIQQDGDLILLKGTNKKDHLIRISMSLMGTVNCWVDDCGRDMFCSECSHLQAHRGTPGTIAQLSANPASAAPETLLPVATPSDQVIIGLGNPGTEFARTPHNVGYETLDTLCSSAAGEWREYPEAWIAKASIDNCNLWLIKIKTAMNLTGPALKNLSEGMHFGADQCILVFDDIDMPIGKVRIRMSGSSGGHRGVASILDALQTDQLRRVKIGIKSASPTHFDTSAVLKQFDEAAYATIKQSFETAKEQLLELASRPR